MHTHYSSFALKNVLQCVRNKVLFYLQTAKNFLKGKVGLEGESETSAEMNHPSDEQDCLDQNGTEIETSLFVIII